MNVLSLPSKNLLTWLILKEKIKDRQEDIRVNTEGMAMFRKINPNPDPASEAKIRKVEEATLKILERFGRELVACQTEFKTIDIEINKCLGI